MRNPHNLKVGDLVIYDRDVYDDFISILYDRVHVVTKIQDGVIYTSGHKWSYSDYRDSVPNELKTTDEDLQMAIRLYRDKVWTGSKLVFNFIR
jgi:hypothetical protein